VKSYLVGVVSGSGSVLALLTRGELGEVAVVVTLPICAYQCRFLSKLLESHAHLVVEDLGLARLGLGDQTLVEDVKHILADLLEFGLDLLAVVADGANMLVRALGLLLLLDGGDDSPRRTPRADDVLVCDGEEVALVNGKFTADACDFLCGC
jgi:hypothetical protein